MLDRTVDELIELMNRSLEELRLISIKTSPLMVTKLIDRLAEGCYLKKFTLSQCCLSDTNVPAIVSIVDDARFLVDLDLSYSQMTPIALLNLTSHLAENR